MQLEEQWTQKPGKFRCTTSFLVQHRQETQQCAKCCWCLTLKTIRQITKLTSSSHRIYTFFTKTHDSKSFASVFLKNKINLVNLWVNNWILWHFKAGKGQEVVLKALRQNETSIPHWRSKHHNYEWKSDRSVAVTQMQKNGEWQQYKKISSERCEITVWEQTQNKRKAKIEKNYDGLAKRFRHKAVTLLGLGQ